MPRSKGANRELLLVAIGVGVLAAIILLRLNSGGGRGRSAGEPAPLEASEGPQARSTARLNRIESDDPPKRKPRPRAQAAETSEAASTPAPEHATIESKRQFYSDNFESPAKSLEGYKLEGLVRTPEGIALAPHAKDGRTSDSDEEIRKGVLESPALPLDFPSNFMMPLWRQKVTEGSGVTVEMAISPDGQKWSRWFTLEPSSDEISPTYPDGRPNPNYGFVGGNGIANGTRLYPFARYRVTMTSGDPNASPLLQEFKIYYVDSAGPDGVLAEKPSTGEGAKE